MKERIIRGIAVILCLVMCLGLTGCGASLGAMITVRNCLRVLSEAKDISFTFHADGEAEIAGETAAVSLNGDGVWYSSPSVLSLNVETGLGEIGSFSAPVIMTNEDGRLITYLGVNPAGEPLWIKTARKGSSSTLTEFDLMNVLALCGQSGTVSIEDDETDGNLLRISIGLPGRLLAPEAEKAPDDLPVTVWIDKKSSLPTKLTADLAPLVRQLLDSSDKRYKDLLTVKRMPVEIVITAVNGAERITLPEESRVLFDLSVEEEAPDETPAPTEAPVPESTAAPVLSPEPGSSGDGTTPAKA